MGRREKILFVSALGLGAILTFIFLFLFGKYIIGERRVPTDSALSAKKQEAPGVPGVSGTGANASGKESLRQKKKREEKEALTKPEHQPLQVPGSVPEQAAEPRDTEGESQNAETEPAQKAPDTEEELTKEEFVKELAEAAKKYLSTIPVGGELPESAIGELSLNENQVSGINEALKNESERLKQVLAEFYRANSPAGADENLENVNASEILVKMLPKMMPDLLKAGQLSLKEQLQLVKGERSVLEWIPRDSFTARLAYELYKGRQKTYEKLALFLNEDSAKKFTGRYLLPNTFVFPGNFNLNFGEVNWEEK